MAARRHRARALRRPVKIELTRSQIFNHTTHRSPTIQRIRLGAATAEVFQPIQRCVATHVNPDTAEADIALVPALQQLTGHANCGVYVHILEAGDVRVGDGAEVLA